MRRLEIDFVAPPRRPRWPGALLLVLSLTAAAALVTRYAAVQEELRRLDARHALLGAAPKAAGPVPAQRLADEAKEAAAAVRQLALPWGAIVEAVESAAHPDIGLLQLQPDAAQRLLRLSAEAKDRDAMLAYLRRLGQAKLLHDAHLVSHQLQADDPRRPVQFVVQAALRNAP